jgi:hypothetical protein
MLARGLFAHLSADTAVSAFVAARIYPGVIPQRIPNQPNRMPAIAYTFTAVRRQTGYCGTDPHGRHTLALDCYAVTYREARDLAKAVRTSLIDFSGLLGGVANVHAIMLSDEFEGLDIEPGLFRVTQSWNVWHVE